MSFPLHENCRFSNGCLLQTIPNSKLSSSPFDMLSIEAQTNSTPWPLCAINLLKITSIWQLILQIFEPHSLRIQTEFVTANPTYSDLPIILYEYRQKWVNLMEGKQRCNLVNNMIHILNPYSENQGVTARSYLRDEVVTFSSTRSLFSEVSSLKCLLSFRAE